MKKKLVLCFVLLCFALPVVADEGSGMEPPPPTLPPGHKPIVDTPSRVVPRPRVAQVLVNHDVGDLITTQNIYKKAETVFAGKITEAKWVGGIEIACLPDADCSKHDARHSFYLKVDVTKSWKNELEKQQNVIVKIDNNWQKMKAKDLIGTEYIFFAGSEYLIKHDKYVAVSSSNTHMLSDNNHNRKIMNELAE